MKKAGRKPAKQTKRRASVKAPRTRTVQLHPCSKTLLRACLDPFGDHHEVCLPFGQVLNSLKVRSFARTTMTVGTNGVGFVTFNPPYLGGLNTLNWTESGWVGTENSPIANTGTGISFGPLVGPPTTTNTNEISMRHVLSALRIRYVGTELNRGGTILKWIDLEDYDTVGMSYAQIASRPVAKIERVGEGWSSLVLADSTPSMAQFCQLKSWATQKANGVDNVGDRPMAIMVTGVPGNKFQVEAVSYAEFRWNQQQQMWTKSHTDTLGGPAILDAVSETAGTGTPEVIIGKVNEALSMSTRVVDAIGSGLSYLNRGMRVLDIANNVLGRGAPMNAFGGDQHLLEL